MTAIMTPWEKVARQQTRIILLTVFHIVCAICLAAGVYYTIRFMQHPDFVVIQDKSGSLYRGRTCPLICRATAEDTARRATFAFLDRSYKHDNKPMCEAIFGKTAQKSLFEIVNASKDEFSEQKIHQFPEIENMTVVPAEESDQCLVWVEGNLYRSGIYMDIPYRQKLEFVLGLRLMQSDEEEKFPLRVLRMNYRERSVYDSKVKEPSK